MNEKHVGLLGATSLIGECLQQRLIKSRWHVTAFSRRLIPQNHPRITWQRLNDENLRKLEREQNKIPAWLCAAPIWVLPQYFDLLLASGAQRIVVLSSTSRFTKNSSSDSGEKLIAQQLVNGETLLQTWSAAHGIEWIILRPTLIYGYGRDKNISEIARFIRKFRFFPLLGPAKGLRQPVHAEDIVSACCTALGTLNLKNRSYNLPGEETITYREMVTRIFKALDRAPRMPTVPFWFFRMALQGLRKLPRFSHWTTAMAERMNQDLRFDGSEAKKDLNFSPRPFKLTIEDLPSQN